MYSKTCLINDSRLRISSLMKRNRKESFLPWSDNNTKYRAIIFILMTIYY